MTNLAFFECDACVTIFAALFWKSPCTWLHTAPPPSHSRPVKQFCGVKAPLTLSGDIVGIPVSFALGDRGSQYKGWVSRLVSSTCLIYCPSAFEVGQAEFTPLCFFVISPPRLQPRWGPSPSTTGYRKYLSVMAPGHWPWTPCPDVSMCNTWIYVSLCQTSAYSWWLVQTLAYFKV